MELHPLSVVSLPVRAALLGELGAVVAGPVEPGPLTTLVAVRHVRIETAELLLPRRDATAASYLLPGWVMGVRQYADRTGILSAGGGGEIV